MAAELGEVLADKRYFGKPAIDIDAEQLGDIGSGQVEPLSIEIGRLGKPSNRCIDRVNLSVAALKDPLQHAAVLTLAGPEELTVLIRAEPVHIENLGQLGTGTLPDLKIVSKV